MRLFNPVTMTEIIPGIHDVSAGVALPDNNWFFVLREIPEGKRLAVSEKGEPILVDLIQEE